MTTKKSKDSLEYKILGKALSFGEAIEALRESDEISQSDLAKKIGISRQYLCDVEKGRRFVSIAQAARFAKAFQHPPAVLVQLAIQDQINQSELNLEVEVKEAI